MHSRTSDWSGMGRLKESLGCDVHRHGKGQGVDQGKVRDPIKFNCQNNGYWAEFIIKKKSLQIGI